MDRFWKASMAATVLESFGGRAILPSMPLGSYLGSESFFATAVNSF
jgi:hypothetical protein